MLFFYIFFYIIFIDNLNNCNAIALCYYKKDANPSDMSTVYATMRWCQEMTKSLGQAYSIQTFDQYAIAKQVEWAKHDTFKTQLSLSGAEEMIF